MKIFKCNKKMMKISLNSTQQTASIEYNVNKLHNVFKKPIIYINPAFI